MPIHDLTVNEARARQERQVRVIENLLGLLRELRDSGSLKHPWNEKVPKAIEAAEAGRR